MNMTDTQQADLTSYITGKYSLEDQELYDEEAPDPEDGCDVAPRTRGHDEP